MAPWLNPLPSEIEELCSALQYTEVLSAAANACDDRQSELGCTFEVDNDWRNAAGQGEALGEFTLQLGVVATDDMDLVAVVLRIQQACRAYADAIGYAIRDGVK